MKSLDVINFPTSHYS